jgi:zinc transporter 2
MSYGYHRSEILGALFSTLIIWVLTSALVYLAILRCIDQSFEIDSTAMITTASCGVVFNIIMWLVLHTNFCFKGMKLGHHGHSHSGDGHGHGHSHGGGSHGHSHGGSRDDDHGHSHGGSRSKRPNSGARSVSHNNKNQVSIPINDQFSVNDSQPIVDTCDDDHDDHNQHDDNEEINDKNNINLRAAAIHVIGDFVQSIGVLIAAIIIRIKPEYKIADVRNFFKFFSLESFLE